MIQNQVISTSSLKNKAKIQPSQNPKFLKGIKYFLVRIFDVGELVAKKK